MMCQKPQPGQPRNIIENATNLVRLARVECLDLRINQPDRKRLRFDRLVYKWLCFDQINSIWQCFDRLDQRKDGFDCVRWKPTMLQPTRPKLVE